MKVLVFVKATPNSEQGILSGAEFEKMFAEMGKFNDRLAAAGIIQDADGLKPSAAGKRIKIRDGQVSVVDGPFAETKELVAGYWIWNVESMDEAVEWAKQCPNPMPGDEGILELRPTNTIDDFAALLTPEKLAELKKLLDAGEKPPKPKAKVTAKVKAKTKAKARARKPAARKAPTRRKPSRAKAKK
jgi:hypothetical protein